MVVHVHANAEERRIDLLSMRCRHATPTKLLTRQVASSRCMVSCTFPREGLSELTWAPIVIISDCHVPIPSSNGWTTLKCVKQLDIMIYYDILWYIMIYYDIILIIGWSWMIYYCEQSLHSTVCMPPGQWKTPVSTKKRRKGNRYSSCGEW